MSKAGWRLEGSQRDKRPVCLELSTRVSVKLERSWVQAMQGHVGHGKYCVPYPDSNGRPLTSFKEVNVLLKLAFYE